MHLPRLRSIADGLFSLVYRGAAAPQALLSGLDFPTRSGPAVPAGGRDDPEALSGEEDVRLNEDKAEALRQVAINQRVSEASLLREAVRRSSNQQLGARHLPREMREGHLPQNWPSGAARGGACLPLPGPHFVPYCVSPDGWQPVAQSASAKH